MWVETVGTVETVVKVKVKVTVVLVGERANAAVMGGVMVQGGGWEGRGVAYVPPLLGVCARRR
jgi:hypothetical protein